MGLYLQGLKVAMFGIAYYYTVCSMYTLHTFSMLKIYPDDLL